MNTQSLSKFLLVILFGTFAGTIVGSRIYISQSTIEKKENAKLREDLKKVKAELKSKLYRDPTKWDDEYNREVQKWVTYTDNKAGFSIKYPLYASMVNGNYRLLISAQNLDTFSNVPEKYQDLLEEEKTLSKGLIPKDRDWSLEAAHKVRRIGSVYAEEELVFSMFQGCDPFFNRQINFYHNNNLVTVSLRGPRDQIVFENVDLFSLYYFDTNNPIRKRSCTDWKRETVSEARQTFYQELLKGEGTTTAQEWFDLFDQIVETIEIF